jgi:endonuclease YncB( thermonuclease family)
VAVHDGDTINVETVEGKVKVRLAEIDAPELKQEFGTQAQKTLEKALLGVDVDLDVVNTDLYGRKVSRVYLHGEKLSVNQYMVDNGYAWVYEDFCSKKKCVALRAGQEAAKQAKKGLWGTPNPKAPWEYRKEKKK